MIPLAVAFGYLVGSIPSADVAARLRGLDLRVEGSGNPGTANALRVGGRGLAAAILLMDVAKGAAATAVGWSLADHWTAAAAGIAAVAGQILNPWFKFRGGKGLGVAAGSAGVAWLPGLGLVLLVMALVLGTTRDAYIAAIAGLSACAATAVGWGIWDLAAEPGLLERWSVTFYGIGLAALILPKFIAGISSRRSSLPGLSG